MRSTILSIDPSFTATGWAILAKDYSLPDSLKLVDYGWIKTAKNKDKKVSVGVDDMRRAREIACELLNCITRYEVTEINSEIPLGSQSANAAKALGIAKGVVASITCNAAIVKFVWMNPFQIKTIVCGNKNAEKEEIINAVEKMFPTLRKDARRIKKTGKFSLFHEAVCDAISVALAIFRTKRED